MRGSASGSRAYAGGVLLYGTRVPQGARLRGSRNRHALRQHAAAPRSTKKKKKKKKKKKLAQQSNGKRNVVWEKI